MVQGLAPVWVGKGLLGLKAQAVARHHPADALDDATASCVKSESGCGTRERLVRASDLTHSAVARMRCSPAVTGRSHLPPPGVTAASTAVMPVASPAAMAAMRPNTWR